MASIHPKIYEDDDFIFYLEIAFVYPCLHLEIKNFSHNVFKRMCKIIDRIKAEKQIQLFCYFDDEKTERLTEMAGFKNTGLLVNLPNGNIRRLLCHQQ